VTNWKTTNRLSKWSIDHESKWSIGHQSKWSIRPLIEVVHLTINRSGPLMAFSHFQNEIRKLQSISLVVYITFTSISTWMNERMNQYDILTNFIIHNIGKQLRRNCVNNHMMQLSYNSWDDAIVKLWWKILKSKVY